MAKVLFKRKTTNEIKDLEVEDGALIYNTDNGKTYMDFGENRIQTGGNADTMIAIGGVEAPTDTDIKIWIKDKDNQNYNNFYYRKNDNKFEQMFLQPTGDTLPVGSISAYGGENIPTNWLKCNGEAISRTDYPDLFKAIGTTYGDGDGSTTFNVPDFIGRVPVGLDEEDTDFDTLGETGGEKEHTLKVEEMPSHNHTGGILIDNQVSGGGRYYFQAQGTTNGTNFSNSLKIGQTGGDQPHNNMQPYTVTNFIIKAKQSVGIVGNVVSDMNAQGDNDVAPTKVIKEYVDKKQTYSTDEVVIGTYNNKPLYRKIISGKLPTGNGTNNFTITDGVITKYDGLVKSSYGSWFPLNIYYTSDTTYNISSFCNASRNNLYVVCGSQYNTNSDYEITLEYTKTTDEVTE